MVLQQPRRAIGEQDARLVTSEARQAILDEFDRLALSVKERKKALRDEAKRWLKEFKEETARSKEVDLLQREDEAVV